MNRRTLVESLSTSTTPHAPYKFKEVISCQTRLGLPFGLSTMLLYQGLKSKQRQRNMLLKHSMRLRRNSLLHKSLKISSNMPTAVNPASPPLTPNLNHLSVTFALNIFIKPTASKTTPRCAQCHQKQQQIPHTNHQYLLLHFSQ